MENLNKIKSNPFKYVKKIQLKTKLLLKVIKCIL